MPPTRRLCALLLTALLAFTGCGDDNSNGDGKATKDRDNDPAPAKTYTLDDLAGEWQGDFEATWKISKDAFLADTMRGADAYPDDPAEKERIVKGEMQPFISGLTYAFQPENKVAASMGGWNGEGSFTVADSDGNVIDLVITIGSKEMAWRVEWQNDDTIHMTNYKDRVPTTLVLNRATE